ncbi:hypothetical protein [Amedibacterium intestinale]|uniref:hypothetical protein n=1 Tax=Amedibacterium intestinale TaxID=2583452 RepID=UPI0022E2096A|nr:hypothetical protein [Amedibacterium intestinale]
MQTVCKCGKTLVIYYGEAPWDGARSLKDMMVDMPKWMEKRFNDYPMKLLEIGTCRNTFQNQDIFNFIKIIQLLYSDKVEELQRYYANIKVGRDTAELVGTITENEEILNYVKEQNMMGVRKEGEENLAPEEAIKRLKSEGEKKGIAKEKIEIAEKMKEKGYSTKEIEELTGILLH